jgi:Tol biopolymer transport system component
MQAAHELRPAGAAILFATLCGLAPTLRAQVLVERVDVGNGGVAPNAEVGDCAMTRDGRVIAFATLASNLAAADTNGDYDVYVRDRSSGTTSLESVDVGGFVGFGSSRWPSLSANGAWLVFTSSAPNLAAGAAVYFGYAVILRDRVNGVNEWVSRDAGGTLYESSDGHISGDGRFVAFISDHGFVSGDTNNALDIYVRDRVLGTFVQANVASDGTGADGACFMNLYGRVLWHDGSRIVFHSIATNLVAGDTNWHSDVFAHDFVTAQTRRVSVDSLGVQAGLDSYGATISPDGRYVTFGSLAKKLVLGDTNNAEDVFVADLVTGGVVRASVGDGGLELDGNSYLGHTTADGRSTSFLSEALNVPGSSNSLLRDEPRDRTYPLNRTAGGHPSPGISSPIALSDDGRIVLVTSTHDLANGAAVPGVYVLDRSYETPLAYCTSGTTSHGCTASMSASGTPSASAASGFVIDVANLEGQRSAMIFYGLANEWDYVPVAWGASSSYLCVKSPTQRTPVQHSGGTLNACDGAIALDWSAFMALNPGALGNPLLAGRQVFAQTWLRDPIGVKPTALSNALAFTLQP